MKNEIVNQGKNIKKKIENAGPKKAQNNLEINLNVSVIAIT